MEHFKVLQQNVRTVLSLEGINSLSWAQSMPLEHYQIKFLGPYIELTGQAGDVVSMNLLRSSTLLAFLVCNVDLAKRRRGAICMPGR